MNQSSRVSGKTTHFSYDVMDKLASVIDPLDNAWAYTYDPNYNLSCVTNPRGAVRNCLMALERCNVTAL